MKCVIIEDEPHVAKHLNYLLLECDKQIQVLTILSTVIDAVTWLRENEVDLIFMDIQLLDGNSFEIFDYIQINTPIVFTTSYNSFAVEAFKQNSIAYLLKPIDIDELRVALTKYKNWFGKSESYNNLTLIESTYQKRLLLKTANNLHALDVADIAFLYVKYKQVFIKDKTGKAYPFENTLEFIEKKLNPDFFFRINRQFIVNREAIKEMYNETRGRVKIVTSPTFQEEMIVSIDRAIEFKKWLNK
ncbi:MAG: LytTR family DNA-binding domain-containing protein [Bacteroidota bacterium]